MKWIVRSVLLLAVVAIATQDITGRKGCDCSICKGVDNKISPIVGKRIGDDGGGKSSCNICERRKELLRMEREKQRQLQKCPFEILGSPSVKGKSSHEIFDEFRELIVPSQNGFFDMMRGIVRTMHVSSEAEMKYAKEKEAKELAKKKLEEAEKAKKQKALKEPKDEIVGLNNPVNPKVTVVLKQAPCGQIIQPGEQDMPEKISLNKRLPKETDSVVFPEEEILHLQSMDLLNDHQTMLKDYGDLNAKENLDLDLIEQTIDYRSVTTTEAPGEEITTSEVPEVNLSTIGQETDVVDSSTESPFVKFISNDEMRVLSGGKNSLDDFDMGLNMLPTSLGLQVDEGNTQNIDYSILSQSL